MDMPASAETVIDRYCAVWSCAGHEERARLLETVWSERTTYTDPTVSVRGPAALLDHIARTRSARPGMVVAREGPVDAHHHVARFRWRADGDDGRTLVAGLDVVAFLADGRLASVVGFFDETP